MILLEYLVMATHFLQNMNTFCYSNHEGNTLDHLVHILLYIDHNLPGMSYSLHFHHKFHLHKLMDNFHNPVGN